MSHYLRLVTLSCFLTSLIFSSACQAGIDINMEPANIERINKTSFKINQLEVEGFGRFWVTFQWNPETLKFDISDFAKEADNTPKKCQTFVENTFCNEGSFPTCDTSQAQISQVVIGMKYADVVRVMGCHGVISSRGKNVVIYTWGTAGFIEHAIGFIVEDDDIVVSSVS